MGERSKVNYQLVYNEVNDETRCSETPCLEMTLESRDATTLHLHMSRIL